MTRGGHPWIALKVEGTLIRDPGSMGHAESLKAIQNIHWGGGGGGKKKFIITYSLAIFRLHQKEV